MSDAFLTVSQFASREQVSRARVLQLIAARRIGGARRIGHHWAIPTGSAMERRRPGRPRGATTRPRETPGALLRRLARSYVWWMPAAEALADQDLVITQTMELGDYDDVRRLERCFDRERLALALRRASPGRLSERSWTYWHYRLGLARPGRVPAAPRRRLA